MYSTLCLTRANARASGTSDLYGVGRLNIAERLKYYLDRVCAKCPCVFREPDLLLGWQLLGSVLQICPSVYFS